MQLFKLFIVSDYFTKRASQRLIITHLSIPHVPPGNTSMVLLAISDIVSYNLHCPGMMKIHRNKVSRIEQLSVEAVQHGGLEDEVSWG